MATEYVKVETVSQPEFEALVESRNQTNDWLNAANARITLLRKAMENAGHELLRVLIEDPLRVIEGKEPE